MRKCIVFGSVSKFWIRWGDLGGFVGILMVLVKFCWVDFVVRF